MQSVVDPSDLTDRHAVQIQASGRRGSGCLISPSHILTSSHLVLDRTAPDRAPVEDISARPLDHEAFVDCTVTWLGDPGHIDVALLRLESAVEFRTSADDGTAKMGRLVGRGARNCEVIGFQFRRGRGEALRISGTVDSGTFPESPSLLLQTTQQLDRFEIVGFLGSGLYCEGCLVGIIVGYVQGSMRAVSVADLLGNEPFRQVLRKELHKDFVLVELLSPKKQVLDALEDVSRADPANIQEVAAAQFALSDLYYENVLKQARHSFNAAVVAAVVGFLFFLAAISFTMLTGQLTASLISLIGGGVVEVVAGLNFWLYGRTASQLNLFHLRLERMQRYLVANSVAAGLTGEHREAALRELVRVISTEQPSSAVQAS